MFSKFHRILSYDYSNLTISLETHTIHCRAWYAHIVSESPEPGLEGLGL